MSDLSLNSLLTWYLHLDMSAYLKHITENILLIHTCPHKLYYFPVFIFSANDISIYSVLNIKIRVIFFIIYIISKYCNITYLSISVSINSTLTENHATSHRFHRNSLLTGVSVLCLSTNYTASFQNVNIVFLFKMTSTASK